MTRLLKSAAWILIVTFLVVCLWAGLGPGGDNFNVTVNGQKVEGLPKVVFGSAGIVMAGIAVLVGLGITVIAVLGSGFVIFCTLAIAALITVAVVVPFLLPIFLPIFVVLLVIMIARRSPRSNRA